MMTSWAEWHSSCITAAWNITCIIFIYIHLLIYYIYLDISRLLTQKLDVNWKDVYYQEARRRKAKTEGKCWKDRLMKNWVEGPDLWKIFDWSWIRASCSMQHPYRSITVVLQMLICVISIRQLMIIIGDCTWFFR